MQSRLFSFLTAECILDRLFDANVAIANCGGASIDTLSGAANIGAITTRFLEGEDVLFGLSNTDVTATDSRRFEIGFLSAAANIFGKASCGE